MAHLRTDSEQERDIQAKIQRLITLQMEEQNHSTRDNPGDGNDNTENTPDYGDHRGTIGGFGDTLGMPTRTTTEMRNLSSMGETGRDSGTTEAANKVPWPSEAHVLEGLPPPSPSQGIGRGTMVFSNTYDSRRRDNSGDQLQDISLPMSKQQQQDGKRQNFPPRQIYEGYGALDTTASHPQSDFSFEDDERHAQMQEHEFYYGNPDFHNPYDDHNPDRKKQRYRPGDNICAKFCCIYVPIVNLFLQENVNRSFCYGSIDGMLTGSGIVSAFCALKVLSIHARWEVRLAVTAFTAATCVADAVCMAIGHVWTSYVVSSGHALERSRERKLMDDNKADSKARLVEMLLSRGMLKIDAMSLADTLEGYPDMFVSALVGDSLLAGTDFAEDETEDGHHPLLPVAGRNTSDGSLGFGDNWKFPSYGQFNEMEHEPETSNVNLVLKESQVEGFFMMLGFATFAIIPSLLWLALPPIVLPAPSPAAVADALTSSSSSGSSALPTSSTSHGDVISLPSLVVSISGIIMWCLGVWKSKFLDSNWIVSGIENVVVLLACVLTAYGVGFVVCYALGGDEGLPLTNIVH